MGPGIWASPMWMEVSGWGLFSACEGLLPLRASCLQHWPAPPRVPSPSPLVLWTLQPRSVAPPCPTNRWCSTTPSPSPLKTMCTASAAQGAPARRVRSAWAPQAVAVWPGCMCRAVLVCTPGGGARVRARTPDSSASSWSTCRRGTAFCPLPTGHATHSPTYHCSAALLAMCQNEQHIPARPTCASPCFNPPPRHRPHLFCGCQRQAAGGRADQRAAGGQAAGAGGAAQIRHHGCVMGDGGS